MTRIQPTQIRINEDGNESHESWLLIRANHVSSTGHRLFDSEITHQRFIQVTVMRCTRKRDLNRDWLHGTKTLMQIDMSEAQWGAFVSSFGVGSGVPATLSSFDGNQVPEMAKHDSRLNVSHQEVKNAASKAVAEVQKAQAAVDEAFERGAGKREMRGLLNALRTVTKNLPLNMEYAAETMSEHVENVVVKARSDVEGMVIHAMQNGVALESAGLPALEEWTGEQS